MSDDDNIGKGALVVYIERGVLMTAGLVVSALLARALSTDHYGIYKLVGSVLVFSSYAASFGLEMTVTRFIPDYLTKGRPAAANKLLGGAILIRGLAIVILVIGAVGFGEQLGRTFNAQELFGPLLVLLLVHAGFKLLNSIGRAFLTAYSRRHVVGYIRIASNLVLAGLIGYLYFTGGGIYFAIAVLATKSVLEFVLFLATGMRHVVENAQAARGDATLSLSRLGSYSGYNWLFKGGHVFREYSVDHFVISYFLGPTQVAFYGVAIAIPKMLRSVSPGRMLHGVLLPTFVKRYEESGSFAEVKKGYVLLQKINIVLLLPAILALLVFVPELIELVYSEKYVGAAWTARILIAFSFFQSMGDSFYLVSHAVEKANLVFYSSLVGLYNLAADVALVPFFGINGAALATGSAGLLVFAYFMLVYRSLYDVAFPLLGGVMGTVLLNSVPLLALLGITKMIGLFTLQGMAVAVVGGFSYIGTALFNDVFTDQEKSIIMRRTDIPLLRRIWMGETAKSH
ncbi:lipopolysaccharide biosynthesis protein [Salinibacter ruber]|jgi:O-antigen/teichoic acid export membrane protein|uniref:lipopolysaccharide biosynthesis protein n=1 Tax=Salinibacter ruber TaxID=146919 RepID=UPI00216A6C3E|nr:oligosaccharide flippase family protein [Salinibacter ruber]MCS4149402.1 O-antigen/teichoic acid export membrane protein [Salinibacter ruber]